MRIAWATERMKDFPITEEGQQDTQDINIAALLQSRMHLYLGDDNLDRFNDYDMIIIKMSKVKMPYESTWMGMVHKLKNRYPDKKIGMYQEAESFWPIFRPVHEQVEFFDAVRRCDFFLTHNSADSEFFRSIKGDNQVFHIPSPMQVEQMKLSKKTLQYRDDNKEIIFGSSFDDRAYGLFGYTVACNIIKEHPEYKLVQYARSTYNDDRNELMKKSFGVPFTTLPYMCHPDFVERISQAYVSMNLMPASAAGRDCIAFASVGIPHIGNYRLDAMQTCFPDLAIDVFDIAKAKTLLKRLVTDIDFYIHVSNYAQMKVEECHTFRAVEKYLRQQFKDVCGITI